MAPLLIRQKILSTNTLARQHDYVSKNIFVVMTDDSRARFARYFLAAMQNM